MPTPSPDAFREQLRALGQRRRQHDAEGAVLARDTAAAVRRAKRLKLVPMTEVATLVGLDRTYLYRRARQA